MVFHVKIYDPDHNNELVVEFDYDYSVIEDDYEVYREIIFYKDGKKLMNEGIIRWLACDNCWRFEYSYVEVK